MDATGWALTVLGATVAALIAAAVLVTLVAAWVHRMVAHIQRRKGDGW